MFLNSSLSLLSKLFAFFSIKYLSLIVKKTTVKSRLLLKN